MATVHNRTTMSLIALIDDSTDVIAVHRLFMELYGHQVVDAHDGAAGLRLIRETRPLIAFVDIGMPGLNGYEIAATVRDAGWPTYMVAVTAYGSDEDKRLAELSGFHEHLTKPPDPLALERAIERALSRAH